jgi:glycosyltransferase involved in cell wall biosynthesis
MRVLWTHNFDLSHLNSGAFMRVFAEGVRAQGVELDLHYLGNLARPDNLLRARAEVNRIASRYDMVHAQFGSACAVATAGVTDVPKLLSLRGSDWYRFVHRLGGEALHSLLAVGMSRSVMRRFDAVIVMSHRMKAEVGSKFRNLRVEYLPDPIDLARFAPLDRRAARKAVGLPDADDRWVLFTTVSVSNPVKRVPLAMRVVEQVNAWMGGVRLRVATGLSHDSMPAFVAGCDAVLCTSVHEGWPNSVKEALACDVPFVATDVSDLRSIAAAEPSCRVCDSDVDSLAEALHDVLRRPRPSGLRRHLREMELEETSRRLVALYRDLLGAQAGRTPGAQPGTALPR